MALAGNVGAGLHGLPMHGPARLMRASWFAETQGLFVVSARHALDVIEAAKNAGVACALIGETGGKEVHFAKMTGVDSELTEFESRATEVSLADLRAAHENFFPSLMAI